MPTVLITGANRGLGLEFARQYAADGWRIIATCRDPGGAGELAGLGGDVQCHALDVTDHARIAALAVQLEDQAIDVLLNNAGIYGPRQDHPMDGPYFEAWGEVMRINVMAPLEVCVRFADHVARSDLKLMAAVTSKMGSIEDNTSGGSYVYRSSKAALNAAMKSFALDFAGRGIAVAMLHPGWVKTDMGGANALIEAEESVTGMRRVIASLEPTDTGCFFSYDDAPIPW